MLAKLLRTGGVPYGKGTGPLHSLGDLLTLFLLVEVIVKSWTVSI